MIVVVPLLLCDRLWQIQLSSFLLILRMRVWDHRPHGYSFCDIPTVILLTFSGLLHETSTIATVISSCPLLWLEKLLSLYHWIVWLGSYTGSILITLMRTPMLLSLLVGGVRDRLQQLGIGNASPRSSDHHSSSSSSSLDSSPVHSLGLDARSGSFGIFDKDVSPRSRYSEESTRRQIISSTVADPLTTRRGSEILILQRLACCLTVMGDDMGLGIDPMTAPLVEEEIVEPAGGGSPDLPVTRDGIDRIVGIETAQGREEFRQVVDRDDARGELGGWLNIARILDGVSATRHSLVTP
ncbi:hypothetical protein Tco_0734300 [Tanacetum coccineum]